MSHVYIIYIYISVQCLYLGGPNRLKNRVRVNFPPGLESLGGGLPRGFSTAQMDPRPFGLNACFLSPAPWATWLCWGNQGRKGNSKALALWVGHVVLWQQPQRLSDVILGSPGRRAHATVRPRNTFSRHRTQASPWVLTEWGFGKQAPQDEP
jgi:hypothetical protein